MRIEFKAAEFSDEKILADLWVESNATPYRLPPPRVWLPWRKFEWAPPEAYRQTEVMQNSTNTEILRYSLREINKYWKFLFLWLIVCDGEAVGYLFVTASPKQAHEDQAALHEIYLPLEFRNRGIERQAVSFIEKFCEERELPLSHFVKPEWKLYEEE